MIISNGFNQVISLVINLLCFQLEVKMKVEYLSFSAHADAKGIMQLISHCEPRNVMLVHGEKAKMEFLRNKIKKEFGMFHTYCKFDSIGPIAPAKMWQKDEGSSGIGVCHFLCIFL